jgi:hypothetical protein
MKQIKLAEWCENNSISYITGYRWFKAGKIDGAYQTDSGTILVPEKAGPAESQTSEEITSLILSKVVDLSTKQASISDFAAYILANFDLQQKTIKTVTLKAKHEIQQEAAQQFFKKFLPDEETTAKMKQFKDTIKAATDALKTRPAVALPPAEGEEDFDEQMKKTMDLLANINKEKDVSKCVEQEESNFGSIQPRAAKEEPKIDLAFQDELCRAVNMCEDVEEIEARNLSELSDAIVAAEIPTDELNIINASKPPIDGSYSTIFPNVVASGAICNSNLSYNSGSSPSAFYCSSTSEPSSIQFQSTANAAQPFTTISDGGASYSLNNFGSSVRIDDRGIILQSPKINVSAPEIKVIDTQNNPRSRRGRKPGKKKVK